MTSCSTNTCGVGSWNGPLPGDPDNNSVLTATPAFGGIDVSWSYPAVNPYAVAHTLLYRGVSSDFNTALLISAVGGNFFYDKSTSPQLIQYYYWIRIVSVNGTVGALIGPASAIAKPTIASVIDGLTGQINAGLLAQSLKTEIDKVTLNYQGILDEADARIAANTALSAALAQVQNEVEDSVTLINQEITQRQAGDSALVTQVNTVAAANTTNLGLIQQEVLARVSADDAIAGLYTTLNSQVNHATTGLPATRATLINDYYTKAGTDSAISSATTSLVSTTALNTALGAYTNTAALQSAYYTKTQTDSAISSATQSLISTTGLNTALGAYTSTAALETNYYTKTQADSAISSAVTTSQSTLNGNITSAQTTLQTNINTVDGKVTEIGALYTAKVSVNGLIGGFGIYNNGSVIQAGFDVDEFWIGSSQDNKRKPFIIVDGTTYIDDAAINKLTFTKLRDESGNVVIEDGKIKANFLQVNEIAGGSYTGYAWPASGTGFYLGPGGLLLGRYVANDPTSKYFQVTEEGNIYTPKMSIVNGDIFFSGNVISTGNITNEAVNIFKLARGASLPDYVRTYKGGVTPSVPVNTWMALQLDAGSLNNKLGANNYDAYRTLLPAGTYFYELSVPVKNNGSDTNDAAYTAIISNPPGTPSGTTQTVCGDVSVWNGTGKDGYWSTSYQCWQEFVPTSYTVLSTAGVNVVGDWQTATIFGVGRFTLTNPTYVSAAVLTTDAAPALQVVSRSGYSSTILRIWRDTSA